MSKTPNTLLTPLDLAALRRIAEAATPGIWSWRDSAGLFVAPGPPVEGSDPPRLYPYGKAVLLAQYEYDTGADIDASDEDRTHIAAFNPQTALRLLAEVTRLTSERDALAQQVDDLETHLDCVAHGLHHYSGCTNHFAGPKPGAECCRCRAEQAESALTTAQQDAARLREALEAIAADSDESVHRWLGRTLSIARAALTAPADPTGGQ